MDNIKNLQTKLRVPVDGIIGKNTLKAFRDKYGFNDYSTAQFFGNTHHETDGYRITTENMKYSAKRLVEIFPTRITPELAKQIEYDGEKIANIVYNRSSLGNTKKGDGWRFIGRGALQMTGRIWYERFDKSVNDNLTDRPELVATRYYWDSAVFEFVHMNLHKSASISDSEINRVRKVVNGGSNGLESTRKWVKHYYKLITS